MTHDELLEVITHTAQDGMADEPILKALRAVVELHNKHKSGSGDIYCYNCQQKYPCKTIQAIKKELG